MPIAIVVDKGIVMGVKVQEIIIVKLFVYV